MRKLLLLALAFLASRSFAADTASTLALERLASLLTGTFSSADQALADKNYRHAVLHAVRIWPDRSDGPWLYVEQALAEAPDLPYRQRVCQLAVSPDGALEMRLFTLDDPIKATGAWRKTVPLSDVTPSRIAFNEGCTVFFRAMPDGSLVGSTRGDGCPSDLRGATHATTDITVTSDQLVSWDRGYNASGRQVWGPASGGYIFKRVAAP
ncbi:chromophore lyase CpcT/CpeT [Oleiharenicola sp. Vm1]|uniref:chromophore lyase CpcT/CpeT n=1 Tax=Oleiharenicola sp. Vm1 TaxID=3398393 RepID=UPI0039F565A0